MKKIMERYDRAVTPEEKEAAKQYQLEVESAMTPEELEAYTRESVEDHYRILSAIDEDIADLRAEAMRRKLGDVPQAVSLSYIAGRCGKSKSWLSQRLCGHKVNGREAHFTSEEAKMVQDALHDLGRTLLGTRLV
ncbi:MAG: DUF5053 domain-containing protein [Bacteroidaceae bacterium]|nr:DUF5053 domain-containing protein [Bacteroidaceae bacterium]